MLEQCSFGTDGFDSGFNDPYVQANVAVNSVFFVLLSIIFVAWLIIRVINIQEKSSLKWYFYGLSLALNLLSDLLLVIFQTLNGCNVFDTPTYQKSIIGVIWTNGIGDVLLLGAILISLPAALARIAKPGSTVVVYAVGGAIVGLVAILMIAFEGENSQLEADNFGASESTYSNELNLELAYRVFYFLGSLLAIVEFVGLLVMSRSKTRVGALMFLIPLLSITLFAYVLTALIETALIKDLQSQSFGGYATYLVFVNLFQTCVYAFLLAVGESAAIKNALNPDRPQAQQAAALFAQDHDPSKQPGAPGQPAMYAYAPQQQQQQYGVPVGAQQQQPGQYMPVYMAPGQQPGQQYPQQQAYQPVPVPPNMQYGQQQQQAPAHYPAGAGPAPRMGGGDVSPEMAHPAPITEHKALEAADGERTVSPPAKGTELP